MTMGIAAVGIVRAPGRKASPAHAPSRLWRIRATCALAAGLVLALGPPGAGAASPSPYAGQETRDIKALSPAEIDDLIAGKGMGFAKAAELNGYPGPAHVLELAAELQLTPEQRARTRAIFTRMEAAAQALGREIVAAEQALEADFRNREMTPEALGRAVQRTAVLQGRLREVHLAAHLEQAKLLTGAQLTRYAALRGYAGTAAAGAPHGAHRHH